MNRIKINVQNSIFLLVELTTHQNIILSPFKEWNITNLEGLMILDTTLILQINMKPIITKMWCMLH